MLSIEDMISTNVGTPFTDEPVLALVKGVFRIAALYWEHPNPEDTYRSFRYWDDAYNEGQDWQWDDVTHWDPLPEIKRLAVTYWAPVPEIKGGGLL
jgi:hypothetical protein